MLVQSIEYQGVLYEISQLRDRGFGSQLDLTVSGIHVDTFFTVPDALEVVVELMNARFDPPSTQLCDVCACLNRALFLAKALGRGCVCGAHFDHD